MASSSESSVLEFRVGLFVLVGLVVIGYMVISVGRGSNGLKTYYPVTLELPNASGLLKNSKVLLAGATVGSADRPEVLPSGLGVKVPLLIDSQIHIARNARVVVGSSGLMGDRYVDVIAPTQEEGGFYQAGDTIRGTRASGMDDLEAEGGKLVGDLRATVANLNGTITRINTDLLKPEMFKNLQDSAANLSATTNNFKAASEKLSGVLDGANGVVGQAKTAMDGAKDTVASAKTAADDVQKAIGDARGAIGEAKTVLVGVNKATDEAVHGPGLLGTLISDRKLSDNVSALVANLRRSGVLFYKDRPVAAAAAAQTPEPTPEARRRSRR